MELFTIIGLELDVVCQILLEERTYYASGLLKPFKKVRIR